MQKKTVLPSFLLTIASLVFLYTRVYIVPPQDVIRPLIILWVVLFLLLWPSYLLARDWNRAALLLSVIVLGFFSSTFFAYYYSMAILLVLSLLWGTYRLLKLKLVLGHVLLVVNVVSLVTIALSLSLLYTRFSTIPRSYYRNYADVMNSRKFVALDANSASKPDIYFIVLDGYGRSDILQQLYDYDNSGFIGFLQKRGFIVPEDGRSNYSKTILSATSTLNMEYVQTFAPHMDASPFWWLMFPWLDHNLVRTSLERIGYTSVSISTGWGLTDNPTTGHYFRSHPLVLSDFEGYLLGVTPLKIFQPALEDFASVPTFEAHRRVQLNNFDSLVESTSIPGPKFVFAHIILPHPPFVFSSNGTPINPDYSFTFNDASDYPGTPGQYREQYIGQLHFLNSKLEMVIESILLHSEQPPIILLQADHGPGMLTDFGSIANTCLLERLSIFSAYFLPEADPSIIPNDLSSVNLFRIVFNEYFDARLPILENAQYYPRQLLEIYDLEDVSAIVDSRENCGFK